MLTTYKIFIELYVKLTKFEIKSAKCDIIIASHFSYIKYAAYFCKLSKTEYI